MASEHKQDHSNEDTRNTDKISGAANSIYATFAGEGPGEGPGEKHELGKGPKDIHTIGKSSSPSAKTKPHDIDSPKLQVESKQ